MFGRTCRCWRLVCAAIVAGTALAGPGCNLIIPNIYHQPVIHNPFPQLSKVAIVPFFNQSDEATVDGREFAMAYFAELQAVPGFEVVPLGVVEEAIIQEHIDISNPSGIRRLAEILEVDAVVVGAVTDYTPYYPPRCGLRVEWYARNMGFHEIPAGYGLPWGTPDEEFIPAPLVFEAELALAKAQLKTQTPFCPPQPAPKPLPPASVPNAPFMPFQPPVYGPSMVPGAIDNNATPSDDGSSADAASCDEDLPPGAALGTLDNTHATGTSGAIGAGVMLPSNWPDERGFIPPPPSPMPPPCLPNDGPIITHTRIYLGNDSEFTEALASYYAFRDDARFGGWQNYLQRSGDFIRFCCHLHIAEMLSARGGAGESRVVWTWPESR